MKTFYIKSAIIILLLMVNQVFSQQKISGKTIDDQGNVLNRVLIINVTKNISSYSSASGEFTIEADVNNELRFVKNSYYRTDKIIKKEYYASQFLVTLLKVETLIPEVKIEYQLTGNLQKDSQHFDDSKKVADLKSSLNKYMRSELDKPLPKNTVPKTFQGHDFKAGQVDIVKTIGALVGLVEKATGPKITTPNYVETKNFLARVKNEVDLSLYKKLGMDEEIIDHFLLYAEKTRHISKNYRKDFKHDAIKYELQVAFVEYSKVNRISR